MAAPSIRSPRPRPISTQPVEAREVGGLGIHILRSLTEEAHYERRNDTNVIRLIRIVVLLTAGIS